MGVHPSAPRTGVGTQLLTDVLRQLAADGPQLVEVKTLDRAVDYQPYEATRAFWERSGFVQIDNRPTPGPAPRQPRRDLRGGTWRDDRASR